MVSYVIEPFARTAAKLADDAAARVGRGRAHAAVLLVNALGLVAMLAGAYALGGYALEHPARDTLLTGVLGVLWPLCLLCGLAAIIVSATGRPRRAAPDRLAAGVAALLFAWPAGLASLAGVAVLAY